MRIQGFLYAIIAAVIYGVIPILGKLSYLGGNNSTMLAFSRGFIALPVLYFILKYKKISLELTKKQIKSIIISGLFGSALTSCFLYSSYKYISAGTATTIHFAYPTFVTLSCILFFKEKASAYKVISLVLSTLGVLMFLDSSSSSNMVGILLALFSAATFAFMLVYIEKSGLKDLHPIKLGFFYSIIISFSMLIYGLCTEELTISLTPKAWLYTVAVSLFASVGAISLLQLSIRYIGSSTASILCMLEPITSIILGAIILNEHISIFETIGCILIVVAVINLTNDIKVVSQKCSI